MVADLIVHAGFGEHALGRDDAGDAPDGQLVFNIRSINIQTWPVKDELVRYWRIANDLYTAYAKRGERTHLNPIKVGGDCPTRPLRRARERDSGGK